MAEIFVHFFIKEGALSQYIGGISKGDTAFFMKTVVVFSMASGALVKIRIELQ